MTHDDDEMALNAKFISKLQNRVGNHWLVWISNRYVKNPVSISVEKNLSCHFFVIIDDGLRNILRTLVTLDVCNQGCEVKSQKWFWVELRVYTNGSFWKNQTVDVWSKIWCSRLHSPVLELYMKIVAVLYMFIWASKFHL